MAIHRKQQKVVPSGGAAAVSRKKTQKRNSSTSKKVILPTPPAIGGDGGLLQHGNMGGAAIGSSGGGSSNNNNNSSSNTRNEKNELFEDARQTMGRELATGTKKMKTDAMKYKEESATTGHMIKQFQEQLKGVASHHKECVASTYDFSKSVESKLQQLQIDGEGIKKETQCVLSKINSSGKALMDQFTKTANATRDSLHKKRWGG